MDIKKQLLSVEKHNCLSPRENERRVVSSSPLGSYRKRPSTGPDQRNKRIKSTHSEGKQESAKSNEDIPGLNGSGIPNNTAALKVIPMNAAPVVPCTVETRITMSLHGQAIVCDLRKMEAEPQALIELLKVTNSERGIWMTVGAYYRRVGKPQIAIIVMNGLLEVMSFNKISGENQKSAFLLLAGCEADIAHDARLQARDISVVLRHEQNSRDWLQKVFGGSKGPTKDALADSYPMSSPKAIVSVDRMSGHIKQASSKDNSEARSSPKKSLLHIHILEREVQCLRDRLATQSEEISDLRVEKGKLEADYDHERSLRRQLEKDMEAMKKDSELARRMEWCALDQLKREVAYRRKAEERAKQERTRRQEALSQVGRDKNSE